MPYKRTIPRICEQCGEPFLANAAKVSYGRVRFCSHSCRQRAAIKVDGYLDAKGYIIIHVPGRGRVKQHRYFMEQAIGRRLRPDEHIHHIDGNRQNNALENLQIVTPSMHGKLHDTPHRKAQGWSFKHSACIECGTTTIKHNAGGLCQNCYKRAHRRRS